MSIHARPPTHALDAQCVGSPSPAGSGAHKSVVGDMVSLSRQRR